jgi:hypothetical protein
MIRANEVRPRLHGSRRGDGVVEIRKADAIVRVAGPWPQSSQPKVYDWRVPPSRS